jgi:hypothetical protein
MDEKTGAVAILLWALYHVVGGLAILLAIGIILFIFSSKFRGWVRNRADKRDAKVAVQQAEKAAKKAVK